jgi:chromosomal replication initiator protein
MDLWFGADAKWSVLGHNMIGIEVSSQFVADCISRMFRAEIQQAIEEVAGSHVGYRISVAADVSEKTELDSTSRSATVVSVSSNTAASTPCNAAISNQSVTFVPTLPLASDRIRKIRDEYRAPSSAASVKAHRGATAAISEERNDHVTSRTELETGVERLSELRRENERRWDQFIPGQHNRLAYTAASMVLERPGQISPLFLHGPHGSGKSHLAIGLAHRLRTMHKLRRVLTLTGEQFTIEFTESARGGGFASFRRKYRDVEVLVIDDLQFCLGKTGTLAELRNTIDMLLREHRQVILVADRSLNELNGLTADLHARLSGGMACGLEPLDPTTRSRLLMQLCNHHSVQLGESTVEELASHASGDARVLQGVVHRLVAQQRMSGAPLDHEQAIRCTLDLLRICQPVVRMADIERAVCDTFGLEEKVLREKTKCQNVSQPRMLAMFLARKYTRTALSEIGEFFGKRQHSTVISAQKKVESWLSDDELIHCGRGKMSVKDILKNLESTLRVS